MAPECMAAPGDQVPLRPWRGSFLPAPGRLATANAPSRPRRGGPVSALHRAAAGRLVSGTRRRSRNSLTVLNKPGPAQLIASCERRNSVSGKRICWTNSRRPRTRRSGARPTARWPNSGARPRSSGAPTVRSERRDPFVTAKNVRGNGAGVVRHQATRLAQGGHFIINEQRLHVRYGRCPGFDKTDVRHDRPLSQTGGSVRPAIPTSLNRPLRRRRHRRATRQPLVRKHRLISHGMTARGPKGR